MKNESYFKNKEIGILLDKIGISNRFISPELLIIVEKISEINCKKLNFFK